MADETEGRTDLELTPAQVEVFAAGLYQLAACDGMEGREVELIQEFLEQNGASELAHKLPELPFDPATAFTVLETSWLRSVFLKAALLLVKSDGKVTEAERETLEWMAMAFGVAGGLEGLEAQVQGQSL